MLTSAQISEFEQRGLLRLPRLVPVATAHAMRDRLWEHLSTSTADGRTGFKTLMRAGAFDGLAGHLSEPLTDLLGAWERPAHWGHPLVTFPSPDQTWAIPASGWHVDSHQWSTGEVPGVVAFTFLDQVAPRGGGTLVMPGSHHLTWQLCQRAGGFMKTREMKSTLSEEHSWFADLWREPITDADQQRRYFHDGAIVDNSHLRIAELCGEPGDVVLMNQRVLHVAAPNTGSTPRMMLSDFIARPAAA